MEIKGFVLNVLVYLKIFLTLPIKKSVCETNGKFSKTNLNQIIWYSLTHYTSVLNEKNTKHVFSWNILWVYNIYICKYIFIFANEVGC